jgi:hypothetical protein
MPNNQQSRGARHRGHQGGRDHQQLGGREPNRSNQKWQQEPRDRGGRFQQQSGNLVSSDSDGQSDDDHGDSRAMRGARSQYAGSYDDEDHGFGRRGYSGEERTGAGKCAGPG